MISRIVRIPAQNYDEIFSAAGRLCNLKESGYVEEEYFFDGTANIYERTDDGGKTIRYKEAPYTSRFLVRRPEKKENFSGNIVIEIMNSTPGFDLDRSWIITWKQIVRNGDIYIGLMSKPNVIAAMQKFNAERYASLSWKNPIQYDEATTERVRHGFGTSPESETGLFWDILMDVAKVVRKDNDLNPVKEFVSDNTKVILIGWSQSGGYILRFMKDFADAEGKDLFDGYFSMGSAAVAAPNLNQEDPGLWSDDDLRPANTTKPFIDMHTESDNYDLGGAQTRMVNGPLYRIYDIAGPSHDTTYSEEEYYAEDTCLRSIGRLMQYNGADEHPNSFPYHFAYQAGLLYLENWIRTGKAPFEIDSIPITDGHNAKDQDGNSIGGWRLPQIDLPICAYYGTSTGSKIPGDSFTQMVYGREEPFTKEDLLSRYNSLDHYKEMIINATDNCIKKGLLLFSDRDEAIERAVKKAVEYGLS